MAGETFSAGTVVSEAHLDRDPFLRELEQTRQDLRELSRMRATPAVALSRQRFTRDLKAANTQLTKFAGRNASATIGVNKAGFTRDMRTAETRLDAFARRRATATVTVDTKRATANVAAAASALGGVGAAAKQSSMNLVTLAAKFGPLGSRMLSFVGKGKAGFAMLAIGALKLVATLAKVGAALVAINLAVAAIGALSSAVVGATSAFGIFGIAAGGVLADLITKSEELAKARKAVAEATSPEERAAALRELRVLQDSLTAADRRGIAAINEIKAAWQGFIAAAKPHIVRVLAASVDLIGRALRAMQPIIEPVSNLMVSWIARMNASLQSGAMQRFFDWIANRGVGMLSRFGAIFGRMFAGMIDLLIAFSPYAEQLLNWLIKVSGAFARWAANLRNDPAFRDWMREVTTAAPVVISMIGWLVRTLWNMSMVALRVFNAVSRLVGAFFAVGSGARQLSGPLGTIVGFFRAVWQKIVQVATAVWQNIQPALTSLWTLIQTQLVPAFAGFLAAIKPIALWFIGVLGPVVTQVINSVIGVLKGFVKIVTGIFKVFTGILTGNWRMAWNGIKMIFSGVLQAIWNFAKLILLGKIFGVFRVGLRWIRGLWSRVWNAVSGFFRRIWNGIWGFIRNIWNIIAGWFRAQLNAYVARWKQIWNLVRGFFSNVWRGIRNTGVRWWNNIRGFFGGALESFVGYWQRQWNRISRTFRSVWNGIKGIARSAWNGVLGLMGKGVNTVIRGVNWLIKMLNKIPGVNLPKINLWDWGALRLATGGPVFGAGTSTSDSIPAQLSNNEHVWTAEEVRGAGGHRNVERLRQSARSGHFADGGAVPGFAEGGPVWQKLWGIVNSRWPRAQLTSAYRRGDPGHHGRGEAIDVVGPMARIFRGLAESYPNSTELIYSPLGAIFDGHRRGPGYPGHYDHLHWAMAGMPGGGGGLWSAVGNFFSSAWDFLGNLSPVEWFKSIWDSMIGKIKGWFPKGIGEFGDVGLGLLGKSFEGLKNWVLSKIGLGGGGGGSQGNWAPTVHKALDILGLPRHWTDEVLAQIQIESGGDPRAINNWDINAQRGMASRGLLQTIPPTFHAYRLPHLGGIFDPLANIVAAMRYAVATYGSLGVWPTRGGYQNGTRSASAGWHWVGENGPELMRFRGGEQVMSNSDSMVRELNSGDGGDRAVATQLERIEKLLVSQRPISINGPVTEDTLPEIAEEFNHQVRVQAKEVR